MPKTNDVPTQATDSKDWKSHPLVIAAIAVGATLAAAALPFGVMVNIYDNRIAQRDDVITGLEKRLAALEVNSVPSGQTAPPSKSGEAKPPLTPKEPDLRKVIEDIPLREASMQIGALGTYAWHVKSEEADVELRKLLRDYYKLRKISTEESVKRAKDLPRGTYFFIEHVKYSYDENLGQKGVYRSQDLRAFEVHYPISTLPYFIGYLRRDSLERLSSGLTTDVTITSSWNAAYPYAVQLNEQIYEDLVYQGRAETDDSKIVALFALAKRSKE